MKKNIVYLATLITNTLNNNTSSHSIEEVSDLIEDYYITEESLHESKWIIDLFEKIQNRDFDDRNINTEGISHINSRIREFLFEIKTMYHISGEDDGEVGIMNINNECAIYIDYVGSKYSVRRII